MAVQGNVAGLLVMEMDILVVNLIVCSGGIISKDEVSESVNKHCQDMQVSRI